MFQQMFPARGLAIGDYNNDGYPDLLITCVGQNRLFRNTGNGTFVDVTDGANAGAGTGDVLQGAAADCNSAGETHAWFDSRVAHHPPLGCLVASARIPWCLAPS